MPEKEITSTLITVFSTTTIVVVASTTVVVGVFVEVAEFIDLTMGITKKLIKIPNTVFVELSHHGTSATTSAIVSTIGRPMRTFITSSTIPCMVLRV
jgi:hypothetical protein